MKIILKMFLLTGFIGLILYSCAPADPGEPPEIEFWVGPGYVSGDSSIAGGDTIMISIVAAKTEGEDVLKTFDISKSINGGTNVSVYNQAIATADEDLFTYDYFPILGTTVGNTEKYTFTITNRDGLTNQQMLTITIL